MGFLDFLIVYGVMVLVGFVYDCFSKPRGIRRTNENTKIGLELE